MKALVLIFITFLSSAYAEDDHLIVLDIRTIYPVVLTQSVEHKMKSGPTPGREFKLETELVVRYTKAFQSNQAIKERYNIDAEFVPAMLRRLANRYKSTYCNDSNGLWQLISEDYSGFSSSYMTGLQRETRPGSDVSGKQVAFTYTYPMNYIKWDIEKNRNNLVGMKQYVIDCD